MKRSIKLNKNERRQTSFPQVWKLLPYFLVKSDTSKHLTVIAIVELTLLGAAFGFLFLNALDFTLRDVPTAAANFTHHTAVSDFLTKTSQ